MVAMNLPAEPWMGKRIPTIRDGWPLTDAGAVNAGIQIVDDGGIPLAQISPTPASTLAARFGE